MARYDDEDKPAYPRDLAEPMHERVAVLEKQRRELEERVHELSAELDRLRDKVTRELGP